MAKKSEEPMRKESIVQWAYAVIGFVPFALGGLFLGLEYFLLTPDVVNIFGSDVGRNNPLRWVAFVILLALGIFLVRAGVVMILHVGEQIRNRNSLMRASVNTQAAIMQCWIESDEGGAYNSGGSASYFMKLSYKLANGGIEAKPIEIVAEVNRDLYEKLENRNQIPIQYAKDDPLIVAIAGEIHNDNAT